MKGKPCNHTIGHLDDFITQGEVVSVLESEAHNWNSHNKMMWESSHGEKIHGKTYKPIDFLDGREGCMTKFKHCPYCGEKIDWNPIKDGMK